MVHKLSSDALEVSIRFSGAEVCSVKDKSGLEFIWQAKKEVWPRHAPVLFPIVGRLKENSFLSAGKSFELGQHGFARDRDFELISSDAQSCTFQLVSDAKSKEIYPFDFIFQVKYELINTLLVTSYKVVNPSQSPVLFSVGAHPAFKCPLNEDEKFEDYFLEFASNDFLITGLNNGLRTDFKKQLSPENGKLPLSKALFEQDALVFEGSQINSVSLCSRKSAHKISMRCEGWPYFGIWSKKGCGEFVCLEPWYGIADHEASGREFSQKDGIIPLEAGKEFRCYFSVSFE